MSIHALPASTVRALGASQSLTDPTSVVKELIDNAIDAQAKSISVEISANTLDVIQVRDDGHGIPPVERSQVAKPYCTSKIADLEDLRLLGGASLGFRGTALSSMVESSGSVFITTRVEGEKVAAILKYDHSDKMAGRGPTSAPVGTGVRVTDFLKPEPVRRQHMLKCAGRTLRKIKRLLQAYAFARPNVRLSFRVLGQNDGRSSWTFIPTTNGSINDTAYKIVGAECASQGTSFAIEDSGFVIRAFFTLVDADPDKLKGRGHFLSVDGRPMAAIRGTLHEVVKMYRETLKNTCPSFKNIVEPFLFLDIGCPLGSYDVNVEPAKDDVVFEAPNVIIAVVKRLFNQAFGFSGADAVQEDDDCASERLQVRDNHSMRAAGQESWSIKTGLIDSAAKVMNTPATSPVIPQKHHPSEIPAIATQKRSRMRFNVHDYAEDGREFPKMPDESYNRGDIITFNPWVLAKMNKSSAQHRTKASERFADEIVPEKISGNQSACLINEELPPIDLEKPLLPTPRASSPLAKDFSSSPLARTSSPHQSNGIVTVGPSVLPPPRLYQTSSSPTGEHLQVLQKSGNAAAKFDNMQGTISSTPWSSDVTRMFHPPIAHNRGRNGFRKSQPSKSGKLSLQETHEPQQGKVWFDHIPSASQTLLGRSKQKRYRDRHGQDFATQGTLYDPDIRVHSSVPSNRNHDLRKFLVPKDKAPSHETRFRTHGIDHQLNHNDNVIRHAFESNDGVVLPSNGIGHFDPVLEMAGLNARLGRNERDANMEMRTSMDASDLLVDVSINEPKESSRQQHGSVPQHRTSDTPRTVRRTRSTGLPLERPLNGHGTHNVGFTLSTSIGKISELASSEACISTLSSWRGKSDAVKSSFMSFQSPTDIDHLSADLCTVLDRKFATGEMVQDMEQLMSNAIAAFVGGWK